MALGRLGKDSIMKFCGDRDQIDLTNQNDSAIHELAKLDDSRHVYRVVLQDNHRHPAIDDVLEKLTGY